ncbi:hypothetical protein LINPERHAP2_LOCUS30724 [Linum perenne]
MALLLLAALQHMSYLSETPFTRSIT